MTRFKFYPKQLVIRVDNELYNMLEEYCKLTRQTKSKVVRELLRDFLPDAIVETRKEIEKMREKLEEY